MSLCEAKPNAKLTVSPTVAPKDETKATKIGGYKLPPATTVRNAGADTKKDALDTKLTINNPINPKDVDCLKKSLKTKKAIDKTMDKTNIVPAKNLCDFMFKTISDFENLNLKFVLRLCSGW